MRRSQQRGAGSIRGERAPIHFQHEDRVSNKSQGHGPSKIQQPRFTLSEDAQRYAREKRPCGNAAHDFPKARRRHHSVRASAIVEQEKKKTNSNRAAQLAMISAAMVQYILQPGVVPSVAVVAKALQPTHSSEQGRRKSMIVTIYTECAPRTAAAQSAAARYRRSSRPSTATCAFLTSDSGTRGKPRAGRSGGKPPHSKIGSLRGIGRSEFSSQLAARFSY